MITKDIAIQNLKKYIGRDLSKLADKFGITTYIGKRQNKGWKGLTLERLVGLSNINIQAPNGIGFELKSVSYIKKGPFYIPKETMAITMINPKNLSITPFSKSHCWEKLKSLVFCACSWYGQHNIRSELIAVTSFDFLEGSKIMKEIEEDYEYIRNKLNQHGFKSLTGKDGKWIQARTKGPGHGSISRAFYARKSLLKEIIKI